MKSSQIGSNCKNTNLAKFSAIQYACCTHHKRSSTTDSLYMLLRYALVSCSRPHHTTLRKWIRILNKMHFCSGTTWSGTCKTRNALTAASSLWSLDELEGGYSFSTLMKWKGNSAATKASYSRACTQGQ